MTTTTGVNILSFTVTGVPQPQGSKDFVGFRRGKPVLIESCRGLGAWRTAVVRAAQQAMLAEGLTTVPGPVSVVIDFSLPRPPSAPRSRLDPSVRPDLDKLVRGVFDALTFAAVVEDDSRVVALEARKQYATDFVGARIWVAAVMSTGHGCQSSKRRPIT